MIYDVDIVGVLRSLNGTKLDIWRNSRMESESCNFLVWTPPMRDLLRVIKNPSVEEQRLFATLQPEYLTASLHDTTGGVRHSPYTAYMEQWKTKLEHGVLVDGYNFIKLIIGGVGKNILDCKKRLKVFCPQALT